MAGEFDRRELLKKAGLGTLALVSLPTLGHLGVRPASANGMKTNFFFVTVSFFGSGPFAGDLLLMNGSGHFGPGQVAGDGSVTHLSGSDPTVVVGFGTWKARRLISFTPNGALGAHAAGVLVMEADVLPSVPSGLAPVPATFTVVCDLPGLDSPGDEGVVVVAPFGTASPSVPPIGATVFSTMVEEKRSTS